MAIINGRGRVGARPSSGGGTPSYDADALAFFTANSTLTDTAQKNAINQFVLDLKSNNLWTLGKFLNFMFLGDSTRVKYNLFNPVDSNSAYRLTLASGFNFSSNGIQGNGTTAYIRTYFIPSSVWTINEGTYGFYSRTNQIRQEADMGAYLSSISGFRRHGPSNKQYYELNTNSWYDVHVNNIRTDGHHMVTRNSSSNARGFRNGVKVITNSAPTNVNQSNEIFLASMNVWGAPSTKQYTLFYAFDGLTDAQSINLNTCVTTLMTTLGINV
jgi:hypothetical protein